MVPLCGAIPGGGFDLRSEKKSRAGNRGSPRPDPHSPGNQLQLPRHAKPAKSSPPVMRSQSLLRLSERTNILGGRGGKGAKRAADNVSLRGLAYRAERDFASFGPCGRRRTPGISLLHQDTPRREKKLLTSSQQQKSSGSRSETVETVS